MRFAVEVPPISRFTPTHVQRPHVQFTLRSDAVLRFLIGLSVVLVTIHTIVVLAANSTGRSGSGPITGIMNVAVDSAVPTWFASAILAAAGILGFTLARREDDRRDRLAWMGLGVLGLLLSIDEVATIHERWGEIARGTPFSTDALGYSWVLGGLVVAGFVAVLYLPFLLRLKPRTRWLLIGAGAVFLAGAVGVEVVNGRIELADPNGDRVLLWSLLTGVEEFLEFIGASLWVYTAVDALAGPKGSVTIVVDGTDDDVAQPKSVRHTSAA